MRSTRWPLKTILTRAVVALAYAAPLALVAWGLWIGAASPEASGHVLRLGHSLNREHPVHKGMEFMAADVERRSGGRLRIEIYADEQLGPERDLIELLQIGSLAMTKVSTAPLESFSPLIKVFSLPTSSATRSTSGGWPAAQSGGSSSTRRSPTG